MLGNRHSKIMKSHIMAASFPDLENGDKTRKKMVGTIVVHPTDEI